MAVVGLEKILYQVKVDDSATEVCVVVHSPRVSCPISIFFDVQLSLSAGNVAMVMFCALLPGLKLSYHL